MKKNQSVSDEYMTVGELAKKMGVEMPITEQLYKVLFEGANAINAIAALMDRPSKNETESDFLGRK